MPNHACLSDRRTVNEFVKGLKEFGCSIEHTEDTVVVKDGDVVVYRALRKGGPGQPYIVMFLESDRIKWETNSA